MADYRISYIITTYNKLPYLREVISRLVSARLADEEIVVADGGSTDGSASYLQDLFDKGQIQQFISERDKGEAHGFNKCILRARGELVKLITDDDAFSYATIRDCASFMQAHPEVDIMMGCTAEIILGKLEYIKIETRSSVMYERWLEHKEPFWAIGLSLMMRRSSFPLLGLFYAGTILPDMEYSYRVSGLKANIAWCKALVSVHVENSDGNFSRMSLEYREAETNRMKNFFIKTPVRKSGHFLRHTIELAKRPIRPLKRAIYDRMNWNQVQDILAPVELKTGYVARADEDMLAAVYRICDEFIIAHEKSHKVEFNYRAQEIVKITPTQDAK